MMCEKWKVKGQLQLTVCTFQLKYQKQLRSVTFALLSTGRIQIRVLTNCQAISTEIGTDSLKI